MRLNSLCLYDWRNYEFAKAEFVPGVNLFVGDNAQGKTNLLEAIVYLSRGQSFRTRTAAELIRFGADFADLQATLQSAEREQSLRAVLFPGRRPRQLYLGGVKKKSSADLAGVLPTVLFCPEDLQVLRSGAQARRRMLDHALCQLRPSYAAALQEYGRNLEQKSRILKDHELQPGLLQVLPDYNERLARLGATIISLRARYLTALEREGKLFQAAFTGDREALSLKYQTVSRVEDPFAPLPKLYTWLREHQDSHARAELESGQCLSGPHKDDFEAAINGLSVKSYGSQGQTRTAAISLKLAERELMCRQLGEEPVLLLDDVLSELDAARQDFLLNQLNRGQVFITCCEKNRLTELGQVYTVEAGSLSVGNLNAMQKATKSFVGAINDRPSRSYRI